MDRASTRASPAPAHLPRQESGRGTRPPSMPAAQMPGREDPVVPLDHTTMMTPRPAFMPALRLSGACSGRSVPVVPLPEGPRLHRRPVPLLDVVQTPVDLGLQVGPVVPPCAHLGRRQRLRGMPQAPDDGFTALVVPTGLTEPQRLQCAGTGVDPSRKRMAAACLAYHCE